MKLIALIITSFLMNSCGNAQAVPNANNDMLNKQSLEINGLYRITTLGSFKNLPEALTMEFDLDSSRVTGYSGCNRFFGDYLVKSNTLSFGPLASTRKMCMEKVNNIEQHLLGALQQINNFEIKGDLLLLNRDNSTLVEAKRIASVTIAKDKPFTLKYSARSRGTNRLVTFKNGAISYKKGSSSKALEKSCSKAQIEKIYGYLDVVNLSKLSKLEPPTTAFQSDGALMGRLIIEYDDQIYESMIFDHGNPPDYISKIVNALISLSEMD